MTLFPIDRQSKKNLYALLFCHVLIALLFGTLFWPITHVFWQKLDIFFFQMLNNSLDERPTWQLFWALANHKLADWVEDLFILSFFVAYVRKAPFGEKSRRIAQLLFLVFYIALIIVFINRGLFRDILCIPRDSPTLILDDSIRLSDEIPWLSIKDDSSKSFPADHGTTALLFAAGFTYFAGWRLGLLASLYAAFLCLPRLIAGAHWLSDILVGSGSITLFCLSWAFCTPLCNKTVSLLVTFFQLLQRTGRKILSLLTPKKLSN